jgi:hypothetical protein
MSALGALLKWVVLLPILVAVVLLAVANDQTITVHLNPFNVDDPVLRVNLALYQLAFALFVLGALIGALVTWASQGRGAVLAEPRRTRRAVGASAAKPAGIVARPRLPAASRTGLRPHRR